MLASVRILAGHFLSYTLTLAVFDPGVFSLLTADTSTLVWNNIHHIQNSASKSKGIAKMHKKYRRQDRDPRWLGHIAAIGDAVTPALPLRRHASISPILSQRYPA